MFNCKYFDEAAIIKIQCGKCIVFNISTAGKQARDGKGILQFLSYITVFWGRNHNKLSGQCQFIRKNAKAAFLRIFWAHSHWKYTRIRSLMTFLPIHVWIALSFEKKSEPLPEQGVISMKSCETEPKLRADGGANKHSPKPTLQQASSPSGSCCWWLGAELGLLLKARPLFSMLKLEFRSF